MLDVSQLDRFACEQAQRPVVVPLWRLAARQRDQVRLLRARQRLAAAFLPFVGQHRLHSPLGEALADPLDRVEADVECAADLRLAPAVAELEQGLGAGARARAGMAAMDADGQPFAVGVGQTEQRGSWRNGQSWHETLLSSSLLYSSRQLLSGLSTSHALTCKANKL